MKIIFSRKGVDSGNAKIASPILPDGTLCLLPIPESLRHLDKAVEYESLNINGISLGKLVEDLTNKKITGNVGAHLDPDLDPNSLPRLAGWRPLFGQAGAAETHLQGMGVVQNDLFLFFGWFREVELRAGRFRYVGGAPNVHMFFGWLQIDERISIDCKEKVPSWAHYHPHVRGVPYTIPDSLYLAKEQLQISNIPTGIPGAGIFRRFASTLILTAPGRPRSTWHLPSWFYPSDGRPTLSYHNKGDRWIRTDNGVLLNSASRGQEFVLDCDDYPEAVTWVRQLLGEAR